MTPRKKGITAAVTFGLAIIAALFVALYTVIGGIQVLLHGELLYGLYMLILSFPMAAVTFLFWSSVAWLVKR